MVCERDSEGGAANFMVSVPSRSIPVRAMIAAARGLQFDYLIFNGAARASCLILFILSV
jgi:hypothetical protein